MTKLIDCTCSTFFFGTYGEDGSAESFEDYNTGCTRQTNRLFAQGHDAKLVGFLVRAEMAGEEISVTQGGMKVTFLGAVQAAASISNALAVKTEGQLIAAAQRIAKKTNKPARKTKIAGQGQVERAYAEAAGLVPAKPETPRTRDAKIKVGRWTYDAVISVETGRALYVTKLQGTKTVEQGQYREV